MFVFSFGLFALIALLPGYGLLCSLPRSVQAALLDRDTFWPLCFGAGLPTLGLLHFVTFALGHPTAGFDLLLYGLIVGALYVRAWRKDRFLRLPLTGELAAFACLLCFLLIVLALTPSYDTAFTGDWSLYYPNVDIFTARTPVASVQSELAQEYFVRRTPLLSLCGSFLLGLTKPSYAGFQLTSLLQNGLLFWGVYLLAKQLFGGRAARFALCLVPLAPAICRGLINPEPKAAATFYLLLAVYFYVAIRDRPRDPTSDAKAVAVAVCSVLAFFYHPSMLFYLIWIYLDQIVLLLRRRPILPAVWWGSAAAGCVLLAPWYLYLASNLGWAVAFQPTVTISKPAFHGPGEFLLTRLYMLVSSIVIPFNFVEAWARTHRFWPDLVEHGWVAHAWAWGDHVIRFYEESLIAAATLSSSLLLLVSGWVQRPRDRGDVKRVLPYLWFGLGATLSVTMILGFIDTKGHARNLMTPFVVLLVIYVGHLLASIGRRWAFAVLALAAAEFAYTRFVIFVLGLQRTDATPPTIFLLSRGDVGSAVGLCLIGMLFLSAYVFVLQRTSRVVE